MANPFRKYEQETEHGLINYNHKMGTTYVTHRTQKHYFKKHKGFGISNTELEIAYNKRVHWILIMYHTEKGTTIPYRYKLENCNQLKQYENGEDTQTIFPTEKLQQYKEEQWT